jgi:HK97 family phage portal protein
MDNCNCEEIIEGHPLLDLIRNVNDEMSQVDLIEATVTYEELIGNAYWYIEQGPLNVPKAIYPLMAQYVRVVRNPADAKLVGYLYGKVETDRIALDASEVINFKYFNPADPDYGLSPLEAAFGAATLMEAQQEYQTTMFDNGGMPEVGIIVKGDVNEPERRKLYAEWKQKFSNKRKGEKAIILQGDMDIKTFGYNPSDTGLEFTQKFSLQEIAGAFGVPESLLQMNDANRASAKEGNYAYMAYTISPKLRRIEQKLNEELASRFDERLFFAFDNPVPEDADFQLKQDDTYLKNKVMTVNEVRGKLGMEPVEWGDKPEEPKPLSIPVHDPNAKPNEPQKSTKGVLPPLTSDEESFTRMLEGYFVDIAEEVDGKLRDATE